MLYDISKRLNAALREQGVPFPVVFGPETTDSVGASHERVVFEPIVDEKRDSIGPRRSTGINPKVPLNRLQAARVRIFARSPLTGATWHDHAERAEKILDHVLAELDDVVRGKRNSISFGAAGLVTIPDEKPQQPRAHAFSGAVYEFDCFIDRAVERRNWADEAASEVTIGTEVTIENAAEVSSNDGSDPAAFPFGG